MISELARHDQGLARKILREVLDDQGIDDRIRLDAASALYQWQDPHAPQAVALTLEIAATGDTRTERAAAARRLTFQTSSGRRRRFVLPPDGLWHLHPAQRHRALTHFARLRLRQATWLLAGLTVLGTVIYGVAALW